MLQISNLAVLLIFFMLFLFLLFTKMLGIKFKGGRSVDPLAA